MNQTFNSTSGMNSDPSHRLLTQRLESASIDLSRTDILETERSEDNFKLAEIVTNTYKTLFGQKMKPIWKHKFEPEHKEVEANRVLTCRFDRTGHFIANGYEDGVVRIVNAQTGNIAFNLVDQNNDKFSPVTCVRWRPTYPMESLQNTILVSSANGEISYWHATSNQILSHVKEENNSLHAIEYMCDGLRFLSAGQDAQVKLYDAGRAKFIAQHTEAGSNSVKHKNRIYALRAHKTDPQLIYSAGWDNLVLLWDLRTKSSCGYIYGPLICGDALDQHGDYLVTGSWREENQLELWDLRKMWKVQTFQWQQYVNQNSLPSRQDFTLYSAIFDKSGKYIYSGSVGTNFSDIRAFEVKTSQCIDAYSDFSKGILCLDSFGINEQSVSFGVADGTQGLLQVRF